MPSAIARLSIPVWLVLFGGLSGCATSQPENAETVSAAGRVHAARPTAPVAPMRDPMALGNPAASVAAVVFSDYECPFCARLHNEVIAALRRDYVEAGKVRLIFKDLPLPMHKEALPAAIAARCAAAQDRFWAMNELLYANQGRLNDGVYPVLAAKAGLDPESFKTCQADPAARRAVIRDVREAQQHGINGTPTVILGQYDGEKMQTRRVARGYVDYATLKQEIDGLLAPRVGGAQ